MMTGLYAAILALIQIALTLNVVRYRLSKKVSLGDGGDKELTGAIRAHGNFTEIVPMALILIYLIEAHSAMYWMVHTMGIMLVVSRAFHIGALLNILKGTLPRVIGTASAMAVLLLGTFTMFWLLLV